ncbi:hypothetical protein FACS1894139_03490 [Planctomycetales bacterium]|nr:hypothetical protein FACS1894107_17270 [Planctomycetales bacterium]GHT03373.1 hypothetical protein FACS1894139_03490 [Planctomycetales bacterium]GHV19152.1 hypothetical protein AGMMS49959_03260 [Planctomycetales bacterium]
MRTMAEIRRDGLEALRNSLGAVDAVRFIQMYDDGAGDYTREKHQQPDVTIAEIEAFARQNRRLATN